MALQCDPPYLGDIGDRESKPEPDPDRIYEAELEKRNEKAKAHPQRRWTRQEASEQGGEDA